MRNWLRRHVQAAIDPRLWALPVLLGAGKEGAIIVVFCVHIEITW